MVKYMSKDKLIGVIILLLAIVVGILYTLMGPVDYWLKKTGQEPMDILAFLYAIPGFNWEVAVILPLWLVVILVCIIAAWIGVSMITTPPPVPLDELQEELEKQEAEAAKKE
jgi:hypothetical protein